MRLKLEFLPKTFDRLFIFYINQLGTLQYYTFGVTHRGLGPVFRVFIKLIVREHREDTG